MTVTTTDLAGLLLKQRAHAPKVKATDTKVRIDKLLRLRDFLLRHREQIGLALQQDLRRHPSETQLVEVLPLLQEIKDICRQLEAWMADRPVPAPLTLVGSQAYVRHEPKGVALILSPWNYPLLLALSPLLYAVAAGNCAIIKPSEFTPATNALLQKLVAHCFPAEEVSVVEGEVQTATELLALKFDHIFFTGSPAVGKVVMRAAAEHLTSVTLELGGKSPALIEQSAALPDTADKLIWGKLLNNGQTCIAPDFALVPESTYETLLPLLKERIKTFYGNHPQKHPSYGRIVNKRQFQRLQALLDDALQQGATLLCGGHTDEEDLYFSPTLLTDLKPSMRIMQEEIFGPILPILRYETLDEALALLHKQEKPLAFYIFSTQERMQQRILAESTAGTTAINETVLQIANPHLPFGGVNNSGIGKAHGFYGFAAFSNERSVLRQRVGMTATKLLYPPYGERATKLLDNMFRWLF